MKWSNRGREVSTYTCSTQSFFSMKPALFDTSQCKQRTIVNIACIGERSSAACESSVTWFWFAQAGRHSGESTTS